MSMEEENTRGKTFSEAEAFLQLVTASLEKQQQQ